MRAFFRCPRFARFTLQLLQLAAPRELLEQSQLAMLDETAHARDCFELASRYLQTAVGPSALPMQAALEETSLREITRLALLEGCIGETVATLEALEAQAGAQDAALTEVVLPCARSLLQQQAKPSRSTRSAFRA